MFVKTHSFDSVPSYITISHTFSTPSDGLSLYFGFQISLRWPELVGSNKLHTGVTWGSLDSSPRASPLMSGHGPCSPVLVTQACTAGTVEDLTPHGVSFSQWEVVDTFLFFSPPRWMVPRWNLSGLFGDDPARLNSQSQQVGNSIVAPTGLPSAPRHSPCPAL